MKGVRKCKRCGEPILFIEGKNGTNYCCDAGWVPFWSNPKGKAMVMNEAHDLIRCDLDGDPEEITDVGHTLHWNTCR